ncbi:uncharacterized protein LOC103883366 [Papio anubis]|uniref:uncharacterized protein LOC103883366 n=1 Tax=Papio anubis TaxID=9555 RepID=UPI0012AD789F|nr:uncharacterized protein LOC103883366 [Papio anubis]
MEPELMCATPEALSSPRAARDRLGRCPQWAGRPHRAPRLGHEHCVPAPSGLRETQSSWAQRLQPHRSPPLPTPGSGQIRHRGLDSIMSPQRSCPTHRASRASCLKAGPFPTVLSRGSPTKMAPWQVRGAGTCLWMDTEPRQHRVSRPELRTCGALDCQSLLWVSDPFIWKHGVLGELCEAPWDRDVDVIRQHTLLSSEGEQVNGTWASLWESPSMGQSTWP